MSSGVRVRWAGRHRRLWRSVINELEIAEVRTQHNTVMNLVMCVNYGGAEIADAAAAIARLAAAGRLDPDRVDERTIAKHLDEPDMPDVDLFIRSSGEQRTSNFLLWRAAYAEMVFLERLWPDFDRRDFFGKQLRCTSTATADTAARKARRSSDGCRSVTAVGMKNASDWSRLCARIVGPRHSDDRRFVVWVAGFAGRCCPRLRGCVRVFMALVAVTIAARPTKQRRTFGLYRFEIWQPLPTACCCWGWSAFILIQAYERWFNPEQNQCLTHAGSGDVWPSRQWRGVKPAAPRFTKVRGARAYLEVMSGRWVPLMDDRRRCTMATGGNKSIPWHPSE